MIKRTPFGAVAVIWSRVAGAPKVVRVLLSTPERSAEEEAHLRYPDSETSSCAEIDAVTRAIAAFLSGENIVFSLASVDFGQCSVFQTAVLRAEHGIRWGSVSTYRLIARRLGKETGARAVGGALARNPFPLIVPCHRAIRSDLHLGGFQGGIEMKRVLLGREGIAFDESGRVVSRRFRYERTRQ